MARPAGGMTCSRPSRDLEGLIGGACLGIVRRFVDDEGVVLEAVWGGKGGGGGDRDCIFESDLIYSRSVKEEYTSRLQNL